MATHKVHITKAGKSAYIEVDDTTITNDEIFVQIVTEGLKACLNSKMTKITGMKDLEGEKLAELQARAIEIAQANLKALQDGTFKFPGSKAKTPEKREVTNEAIRLARGHVRDLIVASGFKVSHIAAKDITNAAKKLVEDDPKWIAEAKANLAHRAEVPVDQKIDLSALGINVEDAKAKADALKASQAEKGKALSAKQAGKTKAVAGRATKAKPQPNLGAILGGQPAQGGHHPVTH